jgi:hypothetical protein
VRGRSRLTQSAGVVVVSGLMLVACGEGPAPAPSPAPVAPAPPPPPPPLPTAPPTPLTLSIFFANWAESWMEFTGLTIGQQEHVIASLKYSDGSNKTVAAAWSSSHTAVATIDQDGNARAVGSGVVTFTAQAEGVTGTRKMQVVPRYFGAWEGDYLVRSCRASGAFDEAFWCGDSMFSRGVRRPLRAVLDIRDSQGSAPNHSVDGNVFLGTLRHDIDADLIRENGAVDLKARAFIDAGDAMVNAVLDPFAVNASSGTMVGHFTYRLTSPARDGEVVVEAELRSVSPVSGDAFPRFDVMFPVPVGQLPGLIGRR